MGRVIESTMFRLSRDDGFVRRHGGSVALVVVGAPLLLFDLGARVLGTNDEARFPLLARDILAHGTWLFPRLNGAPHLNKPPLHAWLIAVLSWPAGTVTQMNAGAASVLAALITVLTTCWIGRRLFGPSVGAAAGAIALTTYGVFSLARMPLPDMTLCAAMTLAVAAYVAHALDGRRHALLVFYALVAVAFWAKGPAGLLPIAVAAVDTAAAGGWRALRRLVSVPGLTLLAALVAPWWVLGLVVNRRQFVQNVVLDDFFAWYLPSAWGGKSFTEPVLQALTIGLPWSPLLPFAAWAAARAPDPSGARHARLLLVWLGSLFVLLGLSAQQRLRYYLPLAPPMALLVAAGAARLRLRRPAAAAGTAWVAAAVGLCLWQAHETRRDNAASAFAAIIDEIRRAPGPTEAVDVPELVFAFYLGEPVVRLHDAARFHGRHLIIADRALPAAPAPPTCRRASGRVRGRAVSLLSIGRCPPGPDLARPA